MANPYHVILVDSALVLAIAALGVNLLLGYTGLLSLGHAAYFGVGGYVGAFLFTFGDKRLDGAADGTDDGTGHDASHARNQVTGSGGLLALRLPAPATNRIIRY